MTSSTRPVGPSGAEIALRLWSCRGPIAVRVLAAGVVAAAIALVIPKQYTAAVSILPDRQGALGAGGLAQVAANFGVNIGRAGEGLTELYPSMIASDRILAPILLRPLPTRDSAVQRSLIQLWKLDELDSAESVERGLKRLRQEALAVGADRRTGLVRLTITLRDPVLAAAVANTIATDLDALVRAFQRTRAQDQVGWVQTRLDQVVEELRASESALRDFRVRNRSIQTSPDLLLQEARLVRDVETNSAVYIELRQQLELAKIDEVKNFTVVHILDVARVPVKKSAPRRGVIVLGVMLLTTLGLIGWTLLELRLQHDPEGDGARVLARVRGDVRAMVRRSGSP